MFFPLFNLFRGYEIGHVFQHPGRLGCFTTRLRAAEPIGGIATLRLGGLGDSLAARGARGASWSGKNDPLGSNDHVFL